MKVNQRMKTVRLYLLISIAATLATFFGHSKIAAATTARRPNVVLIMADDFGFECISANGGESYKTPCIDRLAAGGVRFENCHVQPLCTPTRVQLMTGQHNIRNYVRFGMLARSETTFGNLFRNAGYKTGICGKWQLGQQKDLPQHFGFDESYLWQHTRRPPRYTNPGLEHNGKEIDFKNGEYGPELVNNFAVDFVTRHKDEEFFLYYPMMLTHGPFQPTPESSDFDPKAMGEDVLNKVSHFADMTNYMDKMVGKLDAKLAELGIRDNTLIIFLGDNGTGQPIKSRFRGADYQGGKGTTKSNGTHVPLVVSWPAVIKTGSVCNDLISSVDILPTICQAAGIEIPKSTDGIGFLPQIKGQEGSPRSWLYHWYSPRQAEATELKITEFAFDHNYKLYRDGRFFDLKADPMEKNTLAVADLQGPAKAAAEKLSTALDQYKNARPQKLEDEARATAAAAKAKGKAKKAKKKED
jgi:arylsulfatase A